MSWDRLLERLGWSQHLRPLLYKELPKGTGWSAVLGSLCVLLFGVMAVSGVGLAVYYNPSPDKAGPSLDYLATQVPAGNLLRGIHHWGAGVLVLTVFVHLAINFFSATYKNPRELTWGSGVFLLIATLGLAFTGSLLPWNAKSYFAAVVGSGIVKQIPIIGGALAKLLLGGGNVSGLSMTRFYAAHMLALPALALLLVALHIYLVRIHGISEPLDEADLPRQGDAGRVYRLYPEHTFRVSLAFAAVFCTIIGLALWRGVPHEVAASAVGDRYQPRPEWYFLCLFQLLTYFPGTWEWVGSTLIPLGGVMLLLCLPVLDKGQRLRLGQRPLAGAIGVTGIIAIVYLTLLGWQGAQPYGQAIPFPDRPISPTEARGMSLYLSRECAYCHAIRGVGGGRSGPDLANVAAKHRSRDYLVRYVKTPRAMVNGSSMPGYNLPDDALRDLADFLLALDRGEHDVRVIRRGDIDPSLGEVRVANK